MGEGRCSHKEKFTDASVYVRSILYRTTRYSDVFGTDNPGVPGSEQGQADHGRELLVSATQVDSV